MLGTKLISNEWGVRSANIYIDNQAAIAAMLLTKPNPGHYIFNTSGKHCSPMKETQQNKDKGKMGTRAQGCRGERASG